MITFRQSWPDERKRAARICPDAHESSHCFLAIEDEPVERIIGAAFWNALERPAAPAGAENHKCIAEFNWLMLPHYSGSASERDFLLSLKRDVAVRSRAARLKTRRVFRADSNAVGALAAAGFREDSTNVVFEGSWALAEERYIHMQPTFGQADISSVTIAEPDASHADALKNLIGRKEGLMAPSDIDRTFGDPLAESRAFDPEWSTVILELPSNRVIGAQLIRVQGEVMKIPAMAIDPGAALLPGLGWFLVLKRGLELCKARGWRGNFYCRVNPATNPAMIKMAGLFGYREIERRHAYAVDLTRGVISSSIDSE